MSFVDNHNAKYMINDNPRKYSSSSLKVAKFRCDECGYTSKERIKNVSNRKYFCRHCYGFNLCGRENCSKCYQFTFESCNLPYTPVKMSAILVRKWSNIPITFRCNKCNDTFDAAPQTFICNNKTCKCYIRKCCECNHVLGNRRICVFCKYNIVCNDVNCLICQSKQEYTLKLIDENNIHCIRCETILTSFAQIEQHICLTSFYKPQYQDNLPHELSVSSLDIAKHIFTKCDLSKISIDSHINFAYLCQKCFDICTISPYNYTHNINIHKCNQ